MTPTQDVRSLLAARLELLARELDSLRSLVAGLDSPLANAMSVAAPVVARAAAPAPAPVTEAEVEALPPEPRGEPTIDPVAAAALLGVARQTIDRRLKAGAASAPGAPVDVSSGDVRSRWRWYSEADVRRWWKAVK